MDKQELLDNIKSISEKKLSDEAKENLYLGNTSKGVGNDCNVLHWRAVCDRLCENMEGVIKCPNLLNTSKNTGNCGSLQLSHCLLGKKFPKEKVRKKLGEC